MRSEGEAPWRVGSAEPSGREAELALLLREHDEARAAEKARFVFVRGPAGVGKTHLFGLLRAAMSRRNTVIFEGSSGRDARRTFGLLSPMVAELLSYLAQIGVPEARIAELARVVSPLTRATTGAVMENRRLELYDAFSELVAHAGRGAPVFLFPDLDVADRASLELFRYLAAVATTPGAKAGGLFVASFRDDQKLPASLTEVVGKLSARSLSLGGLDLEGIRAFLSRKDIAEKLLEVTGGNPEALGALLERPAGPPVDFFFRRAERLEAKERLVLDVLGVSNDALTFEVLGAVLARLEPSVGEAASVVDALVNARFLAVRVIEGTAVYRFVREADRQAWREAMPPPRRASLQRELAQSLADAGEVVTAAALLFEVAPGEAASLSVFAGDQLSSRGAHEDAADFYQRALPSLEGSERSRVLERLSDVQEAQGAHRRSALSLLRAMRTDQVARPARALKVARLMLKLGKNSLALLATSLAANEPSTRSEAEAIGAEVELAQGAPVQAIERCRRALAAAQLSLEASIALRNVMGKALLVQGAAHDAAVLFEQNAADAESKLPLVWARAKTNQGVAASKAGDREAAIACYQAAASAATATRHVPLANLGSLYADSGDFEPALEHLTRALQLYSRFESPRAIAQVASNLGRLHHFLGDLDRATELSEHALSLALELGDGYVEANALLNLGAIAIDRTESAEAQRCLEQARTRFELVGNDGFAALAAALKARAHLQLGERAQATVELGRRCIEKGSSQMTAATIEVELTRGDLCLQLGDLHGAGRAAARARDALLATPDLEGPYRVYLLTGKLRAAAADPAGAQSELLRSWRLLDELTQRVPPVRRQAFLSMPRRSEVLAAVEPELKLPRSVVQASKQVDDQKYGLVGRSSALQRITRQLEPIGRSNATVLIRGESGTGKELLAEALHHLSPRKAMPIIKVNCAAMVEELLLSELFGHEKGAFTGAVRERKGRFELADGGTLFLDEIGDISPKCQVALLRVLQERELERVGGTRTIKVDVRVICATNRDLEALIAQGRFRADLYYRLKGVMLELPALRERPEDIGSLASHFLERIARDRGETVKRLSDDAVALLARHSWPGNVRELENVLSAAAIFAESDAIGADAFMHVADLRGLVDGQPAPVVRAAARGSALETRPPGPAPSGAATEVAVAAPAGPFDYYQLARQRDLSLKDLRHEIEMQCIKRALSEAQGNISEAARLLKMKRSRLSQIVNGEGELKEVAHGDDE